MDDIILGCSNLSDIQDLIAILQANDFKVAPEKIQTIPPFRILGSMLFLDTVSPVKLQLNIQDSYTLTQLQKVLGEINWIRS